MLAIFLLPVWNRCLGHERQQLNDAVSLSQVNSPLSKPECDLIAEKGWDKRKVKALTHAGM